MVRQAFHNYDKDMQEKDVHVQRRIQALKSFQARAIHELKELHSRLRKMVPLSEFQNRGSELDLFKHKNADLIQRTAQLDLKVSKLRTEVRKNMEAQEKLRELNEIKEATEDELDMIRARLEARDPRFRWENQIFSKVVATLKRCKVSPSAAF
jgi:hypothetical protein